MIPRAVDYRPCMRLPLGSGTEIECRVCGPARGTPVFFVHGFPLDGEMWQDTVQALSDRFLCIVPDLRGFGKSVVSSGTSITIATYADDCVGVLDALGETRPAVFVGLSMGGIILFELYRRHASRIRALALCNTRANAESEEGRRVREDRARLAEARGAEGVRITAEAMLTQVLAPEAAESVRERVLAMMLRTPALGLAGGARALATRADSWPTLGVIRVPTLFVAGDRDQITPPELLREMQEKTPGSRLMVIAGAGHLPPIEAPAEFASVLREYLKSLD